MLQGLNKLGISYWYLEGDPLARLALSRELKELTCGHIKDPGPAKFARPKSEVLELGEVTRVCHNYDELTDGSTCAYQNEVTHDNLLHAGSDALIAALVARR